MCCQQDTVGSGGNHRDDRRAAGTGVRADERVDVWCGRDGDR